MGVKRLLKFVGGLALAVGLAAIGLAFDGCGFEQLKHMRELERTPRTQTVALLPGEVLLDGKVTPLAGELLSSPDTSSPCVHFRYLVEREERDSDGDTRWVTVRDESRSVERFALTDETGAAPIRPSGARFTVHSDHVRRAGDMRYTEYRLDPGDPITVFGFVERVGSAYEVGFTAPGSYTPFISQDGEASERRGMAAGSVFASWAACVCLSLALLIAFLGTGLHQLLLFLAALSLTLGTMLVGNGLRMVADDLQGANVRTQRHDAHAREAFREVLDRHGVAWDGAWGSVGELSERRYANLTPRERQRLDRIRLDLARAVDRTSEFRARFPEVLVASTLELAAFDSVALPGSLAEERARLEDEVERSAVHGAVAIPVGLIAVLLSVLAVRYGFNRIKLKRMIENLPTTPASGVTFGVNEVIGKVELPAGDNALRGPLSNASTVFYTYKVEEKRQSGKKTTWVTVESREERIPMLCRDASGAVRIEPAGAEVVPAKRSYKSTGGRRYTETRIEVGDDLYVLGSADIDRKTYAGLIVRQDRDDPDVPFLLSNYSEAELMHMKERRGLMALTGGLDFAILAILLVLGFLGAFTAVSWLSVALVTPGYLALLTVLLYYNDLVFLRLRVGRAWSNIDVSLKKRFDLVTNLEAVTKQELAHEREVHEAIAGMRARIAKGAPSTIAEAALLIGQEHTLMQGLLGLRERYPDLKGDRAMARLMTTLGELENEIAMMRAGYNAAVERYNTRIHHVPELFLARLGGFTDADYFRVDVEVRAVPRVALGADEAASGAAAASEAAGGHAGDDAGAGAGASDDKSATG